MKHVPALAFIALLACSWQQAAAVELINMGHLDVSGTYSEIKDGSHDRGVDAAGFYSPVLKVNNTFCLIPLFDFRYSAYPQYLPQDEGRSFYNTYLVNNFHLAARKEFNPGWFFKLTALTTWSLMQETPNATWGKGLYDYYDVGANAEIRHLVKEEDAVKNYSGSVQYYRRTYPNFQTLISSTSVTPPEVNEKDYDGIRYLARMETAHPGVSRWYVEPYIENKFYVDKHLVADDGTLSPDEMRFDYEFGLNAGTAYTPKALQRITFSLDGNYTFNKSTMDYYDSRNTLALSDDVFTPDYYNYTSINARPSIEYAHPFGREKAIRLRLGYDLLYRMYSNRKALTAAGAYTDHEQIDREQSYSATLNVPVTKALSWVTNYTYTHVSSNQEFEDFYRYRYDSYVVKSGFSLDF
jgi:hypothetical protein